MSFTVAPNTRLLVISTSASGGYDIHFVFQNGARQISDFVATTYSRAEAVARARAYAEMSGECWVLILEERRTEWLPPVYPELRHRVHAQYAV